MPVKSQAQRRFMYATAEGKTDVKPSVGKDFIEASHGLKGLPEHVKKVSGHKGFTDAMKAHGVAKGANKRHPSTGHFNMGPEGNKFRSR